jgi:hypothetical protein
MSLILKIQAAKCKIILVTISLQSNLIGQILSFFWMAQFEAHEGIHRKKCPSRNLNALVDFLFTKYLQLLLF